MKVAATTAAPFDAARFHYGRRDGFAYACQPTGEAERLLARLLPDPDELFRSAAIFKPGSRTHGGRVLVDGVDCFLKRYNDRGPWYRFRHAFIPARAVRTWRLAWQMLAAGVPVPEPLVCLEERRCRLLFRSYVLMRFTGGGLRLRDAWGDLGTDRREVVLAGLACVLANMHRAGALHGDLKWDNILVAPDDPSRVVLVDLDGGCFPGRFRRQRAERDLQRFVRDLEKYGEAGMPQRFINAWRQEVLR